MDLVKEIFAWMAANYVGIFISVSIIITGLEGLVRLTPTKKDDSALERIGKINKWIMDMLRIPNVKRDGSGITVHEKK